MQAGKLVAKDPVIAWLTQHEEAAAREEVDQLWSEYNSARSEEERLSRIRGDLSTRSRPSFARSGAALLRARAAAGKPAGIHYAPAPINAYQKLLAEGSRQRSNDWHKAANAYREAIALRPDLIEAYFNLGNVLSNAGRVEEAALRYLEAMERTAVGSERWARAAAAAFDLLRLKTCAEVTKPVWWNDEGLKALSASVVQAAPNDVRANSMRAILLSGLHFSVWDVRHRSAAELVQAAEHFERAAELSTAPARKFELVRNADKCLSRAEADQACFHQMLLELAAAATACRWAAAEMGAAASAVAERAERLRRGSRRMPPIHKIEVGDSRARLVHQSIC
jgi:tetratricopeptide (TPR) repeat protein